MYNLYRDENLSGVFVHVPRTGGTFVVRVLGLVGLNVIMQGTAHAPLYNAEKNVFTFAFVRHPLTWYQSMFSFRRETFWPDEDSFPWSKWLKADNIDAFVDRAARMWPEGWYSEIMDQATVDRNRVISMVGRYESLMTDLAMILREMKELPPTRNLRPVNSTLCHEPLSKKSVETILSIERKVIERWY